MTTLSVALATFNEEENIKRCLDSVKDIADEIVIVDGTSTDRTVEIAKTYGAKIEIRENPPIFHINKQRAIDKCTGDWILQLDADEVVSPELAEEIKEIIGKNLKSEARNSKQIRNPNIKKENIENSKEEIRNSDVVGYWMSRKNFFLGRFLMKGGQFPDYTIRLYRKGKGYLPQKNVHEQAIVEGEVGYLKHSLLHYPYKNFGVYIKKWNRYTDLIAKEIESDLRKKSSLKKTYYAVGYLFLKPAHWMFTTYLRHKGFYDGWPGFVFSLFSALRFPVSFLKYLINIHGK